MLASNSHRPGPKVIGDVLHQEPFLQTGCCCVRCFSLSWAFSYILSPPTLLSVAAGQETDPRQLAASEQNMQTLPERRFDN